MLHLLMLIIGQYVQLPYELFFIKRTKLISKPMKGTIKEELMIKMT